MAIIATLQDTTSKVAAAAIAAVTSATTAMAMAFVAIAATAATAAATAAAMAIAFLKSPLCPQLMTSAMAIPGLLYVLDAYDAEPVWCQPILEGMKVKQKFRAIGVKYESPVCNAMMAAVGATKISVAYNHFVLKGGLDLMYAVVSTLGFFLVIYAHRAINDPIKEDIFPVVLIVAFWRIYYLGKSKVD